MKTAMQELIEKVEHDISFNVKYTWIELFNDMELLLEKEKKQIINAVEFGLFNVHTTIDGKYYYDLKYNKNK
jgi:transcriptional regulator CtsR